jgi:hypothetical protein
MRQTALAGGVVFLVLAMCAPAYATYSVVGVNLRTGEVGIAGAS